MSCKTPSRIFIQRKFQMQSSISGDRKEIFGVPVFSQSSGVPSPSPRDESVSTSRFLGTISRLLVVVIMALLCGLFGAPSSSRNPLKPFFLLCCFLPLSYLSSDVTEDLSPLRPPPPVQPFRGRFGWRPRRHSSDFRSLWPYFLRGVNKHVIQILTCREGNSYLTLRGQYSHAHNCRHKGGSFGF